MKILSALVLLLGTATAHAIPVTFNFTGQYLDFSTPPVLVTSTVVDARFTVDTSNVAYESYDIFTDSTGTSCLGRFEFDRLPVTDFSARVSGQEVWSGNNLFLKYEGDNPSGRCRADGSAGFFSWMSLSDGENSFSASTDVSGTVPLVPLMTSPDRVGFFLTGLDHFVEAGWRINGVFGSLPFGGSETVIVPEPGTLGMFGVGLLLSVLSVRLRRPAKQHAMP